MNYQNPENYDKPPYFSNLRLGITKCLSTFLKTVELPYRKSTILDVGCGTGKQTSVYREREILNYVGIDPSLEMIEIAKKRFEFDNRIQFINENLSQHFNRSGVNQYSIVSCCSVLYHINNNIAFLHQLGFLVMMDGYLILETDRPPNKFDSLMIKLTPWFRETDWEVEKLNYNYSQKSIVIALERLGFRVKYKYGIHFLTQLLPFEGTSLNLPRVLVFLYNLVARIDRHIAPHLPEMCSNFLLIAQKKV